MIEAENGPNARVARVYAIDLGRKTRTRAGTHTLIYIYILRREEREREREMKQRWMHFYFVNEIVHCLFLFAIYTIGTPLSNMLKMFGAVGYHHDDMHDDESSFGILRNVVECFVVYIMFYTVNLSIVAFVLYIRRSFRMSKRWLPIMKRGDLKEEPEFRTFTHITARDGIKLNVRVADFCKKKRKKKRSVMLLAAPLGQCGPSVYKPILRFFGDDFVYVTWDYRGLFGSESPAETERRLSVRDSAEDAIEVLSCCGYDSCDVMIGHSMGTIVALESVLLYPKKIKSVILLNGFHGHVFSTAFQPLVRIPLVGDFTSSYVEALLSSKRLTECVRVLLSGWLGIFFPLYSTFFGSSLMRKIDGPDYLSVFLDGYMGPLFRSPQSLRNYLRLFQELDAHSVYHLLPTITQPLLMVSGLCDMLTPAMQSVEIARRVPGSEHYCDPFSSHMSILESPEQCVAEIAEFLYKHRVWKNGKSRLETETGDKTSRKKKGE